MRQQALKPVWKRKFVHTTDSKHDLPVANNVLNRQCNPSAPNLAYVSDITYIRTGAGWLYLATVLDLYARTKPTSPTTSSASITASASIQHWAICRPLSTNRKWQNENLSLCPKLLDHRSSPLRLVALFSFLPLMRHWRGNSQWPQSHFSPCHLPQNSTNIARTWLRRRGGSRKAETTELPRRVHAEKWLPAREGDFHFYHILAIVAMR